jgi:hypothetical protein
MFYEQALADTLEIAPPPQKKKIRGERPSFAADAFCHWSCLGLQGNSSIFVIINYIDV